MSRPEFSPDDSSPEPVSARVLARVSPTSAPADFPPASLPPGTSPRYQAWARVLGTLAIVAIVAVSFLIGSRIGWLRVGTGDLARPAGPSEAAAAAAQRNNPALSERTSERQRNTNSNTTSKPVSNPPAADELVVYEKGKVIFRMKPAPAQPGETQNVGAANAQTNNSHAKNVRARHNHVQPDSTEATGDSVVKASSVTKLAPLQPVWLSPTRAETRLLSRIEPEYPPEARAAHRSGNVVLEVQVSEDGSVSNIRTLSGDPVLAAAATSAVRAWRYQPFRQHDHPSPFQTDVTLTFTLPD